MTATDTAPKKTRHRFAWLLGSIAVVIGITAIVGTYFVQRDRWRLAAVIRDLDVADPNWRWEAIEAQRKAVPDDANAAQVVIAASKKLPAHWPIDVPVLGDDYGKHFDQDLYVQPAAQLDSGRLTVLRDELAKHQEALREAKRLVDFRQGRYPIAFQRNTLAILYPYSETHRVADLLWYDAALQAQHGKVEAALDDCRALVDVSLAVGDEPSLHMHLLRIAIRNRGLRGLERVLGNGEATEPALTRVQQLLIAAEDPPITAALRGERASLDIYLQAVEDGTVPFKQVPMLSGAAPDDAWHTGWGYLDDKLEEWSPAPYGPISRNRAALLEYLTKVIAIADSPPQLLDAPLGAMEARRRSLPPLARALAQFSIKAPLAHRKGLAELRCAIAAVAVERYRLASGHWPASLGELTPNFLAVAPLDPFDGLSLRYKRTADGVLVYSIGPDDKDDGGKIDRSRFVGPDLDTGFLLWDPEHRRQAPMPAIPKDPANAEKVGSP